MLRDITGNLEVIEDESVGGEHMHREEGKRENNGADRIYRLTKIFVEVSNNVIREQYSMR